jgi:hypothetical protein
LNRSLKLLLAGACVVIGYVGVSGCEYYLRQARLQEMAKQRARFEEFAKQENILAPLRAECGKARGLLAYYSTPRARQKPGMMSWDDARLFVEHSCSDEQLRNPARSRSADRTP